MLITDEYQEVLRQTRRESGAWGTTGHQHANTIRNLLRGEQYKDILDYGAGSGSVAASLQEFNVSEYDPGIEGKEHGNEPRSFVVCLDVLEHIEPDLLEAVLADIDRCLLDKGYFVISCRKAMKTLADGRNAHLIVKPPHWWSRKLQERFELLGESWEFGATEYRAYVRAKDLASKD